MPLSYRALCSDFYINQKLAVKLDLPAGRDTVLELFERVRRGFPEMQTLKRYKDELALESPAGVWPHRWLAVRASNIRSGVVNPDDADNAYEIHRVVLETAPYFLTISPLDIEYVELLFGFDMSSRGNHDAIVADALISGSPLGNLQSPAGVRPIDFQPSFGLTLEHDAALPIDVHFEVKTRSARQPVQDREEPISVYVTLRAYEPAADLADLGVVLQRLTEEGERIVTELAVPSLLAPIREAIAAGEYE